MRKTVIDIIQKSRIVIVAIVLATGVTTATIAANIQPQTVSATTTCPQDQFPETNIVYCGFDGPTDAQYISQFQSKYTSNTDFNAKSNTTYTDLQAVYNYGGASTSLVDGMTTSNTKIGTIFSNGDVTVNGQTVGTNANIAGRWHVNGDSRYKLIEGNVFIRPATVYFFPGASQVQVLIHFNSSGQADFGFMLPCGNLITFTATPAPKSVSCISLQNKEVGISSSTIDYSFTATADDQNMPITSYVFNFGDGISQTVPTSTSQKTATIDKHSYTLGSTIQTVSASVTVFSGTTAAPANNNCTLLVSIPPVTTPVQGSGGGESLTCSLLSVSPVAGSPMEFTFTTTADAQGTTITTYTYDFGDGSPRLTTNQNSVTYTYKTTGSFPAQVFVSSADITNQTSPTCQATARPTAAAVTTAASGSGPTTPPATTTAAVTALADTGPGDVFGIVSIATVAGGLLHRYMLRRKLQI